MSDPKRLFEDDDLAETLLGSARRDAPSKHARDRAAVALGLGLATAAATTAVTTKAAAAATAAGVASTSAGGGTTTATALAGAGLWTKVALVGAVTIAVAGGGTVIAKRSSEAPAAPVASAPAVVAASRRDDIPPPAPRAPVSPSDAIPTATPSSLPPAVMPRAPTKPHAEASADGTDDASPLVRETRAIDDARKALNGGDAAGALAALDRHDRAFPNGPLRTEANVLRVDALVAKGDRPAAKRLAAELLARDPAGPHARHLRSVTEP